MTKEGIMDREEINNSQFYNWNTVFINYCSGTGITINCINNPIGH